MAFVLTISVGAFAQPGPAMENVVLTARATSTIQYGGPTRAEGRSYNFTPVFFIYPDGKLDEAGAEALLQGLDIQPLLDSEYGTAMVINPVGDKYAADADFEAFVNLFNASRGPGNLKVVGIGQGATFVNQVIAPKAGCQTAGILSVDGKPGKAVDAAGVPAYIAGKGAAKVAKPYQAAIAAHADEPLLKVVVNPAEKASLKEVFAEAWKEVLGRNYRYNNYNHTHYEGAQFGQYGSYELEPYLDCESLGIKRIIVEQPVGRGQRGQDTPKQLWWFGRRSGGGVTFGSEAWSVRNVVMRGCRFEGAAHMLLFKMRPDTPQTYEYVQVEDCTGEVGNVIQVYAWRQFFEATEREDMPPSAVRHVTMRRLDASCRTVFARLDQADDYTSSDFLFEEISATAPDASFDTSSIQDCQVRSVKLLQAE